MEGDEVAVGAREAAPSTGGDAFVSFYRRERAGLHRALALTLADADLAAEAVDEGMTRAFQRWGRVARYRNPAGWVYRVSLNWAVSRLRRRKRSVPVADLGETADIGDGPRAPDDELQAALAALPPKQRAVMVLRFHLDWSIEQIATALEVPPGTVKSRLHRGISTLRERMEGVR